MKAIRSRFESNLEVALLSSFDDACGCVDDQAMSADWICMRPSDSGLRVRVGFLLSYAALGFRLIKKCEASCWDFRTIAEASSRLGTLLRRYPPRWHWQVLFWDEDGQSLK
jgi:hypothetical protein